MAITPGQIPEPRKVLPADDPVPPTVEDLAPQVEELDRRVRSSTQGPEQESEADKNPQDTNPRAENPQAQAVRQTPEEDGSAPGDQ